MKTQDEQVDAPVISPSAIAEASVWVVRLHDDDRNRALKQGLAKWLKASPVNAHALAAATEMWEVSQGLRRVMPIPRETRRAKGWSASRTPMLAALAASVALVVIAIVFYVQHGTFTTGVGEQRIIALDDGSRVYLNTATTVVRRYDAHQRLIELKSGEAYFDVAKDGGRPFVVRVGSQEVRALGTAFVVRRDARELAVTLVEGKVAVSAAANAEQGVTPDLLDSIALRPSQAAGARIKNDGGAAGMTVLKPGERMTFVRTPRLSRIDTPALASVTAWRRGQVVLENTPLAGAVEEMNRYSTTKIVCEGEGSHPCPELMVNGLFQAGDSEKFAHVISVAYGLDVSRRGDEIVLRGTPNPAPGVRKP